MNTPQRDSHGWYSVQGAVDQHTLQGLAAVGHIDKLSITKAPPLTVTAARLLRQLQSVAQLWLWCDVSRIALHHVVQIPGLEVLDVLAVKAPGSLSGFERASSLRTLRANIASMHQLRSLDLWATCLSESDLELLRELPVLEYLSVGGYAGATSLDPERVVSLLLALPSLKRVWLDGLGVSPDQVARMKERSLVVRVT